MLGRVLCRVEKDGIKRNSVFVCTKIGFAIMPEELSIGWSQEFIKESLDNSLKNICLKTIDLVYLHNAFEVHHPYVNSREQFMQRQLLEAFKVLEQYRREQKIRYYGMATWRCFRVPEDSINICL